MKRITCMLLILCCLYGCKTQQATTSTQFAADVQRDIPFRVSGLKYVKDNTYSFGCDGYVTLLPDYEVDAEGACMVYRTTFMSAHDKQPTNVIWRNIVINHKEKRVLCIDRFVKDGKTFGYVYVLQSEMKQYSDVSTFHWDVSDQRLMLNVSEAIEGMSELSITTLNVQTK